MKRLVTIVKGEMLKKALVLPAILALITAAGCATTPPKIHTFNFNFEKQGLITDVAFGVTQYGCAALVQFNNKSTTNYKNISLKLAAYSADKQLIGSSIIFLHSGLIAEGKATVSPGYSTVLSPNGGGAFTRCPSHFDVQATISAF